MQIIQGIVIHGDHRGKKLGFPTANVSLHEIIPEGIFFSKITIDTFSHSALTFIGKAQTFESNKYQSETYILDFDEDIYGKEVTIQLLEKVRDNMKFSSQQELVQQMKDDEIQARKYFSTVESS